MQLSDIIQTNSDRVFIVDTECYIIFTGVSLNDDRPFIRIGTWYDLPVEIIPLVENIIVSDRILGNPSYEQFNIDVRNLEANRYIGGESILKRFLEYQRIFGLDLTNVSIVNIEKDIPELSSQKNISDRNQFIGIFYSDGNIKINHGTKTFFDLNSLNREHLNNAEMLDKISANSKNSERYKGSGLLVIDNNPVFYHKGYFTSYQFPDRCLNDFSLLQINPNHIRGLLLPSQNLINISGFMKFKNQREGKIKLYSDNTEQTELIKKLFKNAIVSDEKFSSLHINTGDGLKINSYPNSPNIRTSFRQAEGKEEEIQIPFIKSPVDTAKILKEKSDAVLITYTAYEESVLLFKSTVTPVIIVDDGNRNIKKLSESDKIILKPGMQYDLKKFRSFENLLSEFDGLDEIKAAIENFDKERLESLINSLLEGNIQSPEMLNLPHLLKAYMGNTSDRKKYSSLKEIHQNISPRIIFNPAPEIRSSNKIVLALFNNTCCTILKPVNSSAEEKFIDDYSEIYAEGIELNHEQRSLGKRILEDRERLRILLEMFYKEITETPSYSHREKEMSLLKNEISTRKDVYNSEFYSNSNTVSKKRDDKKDRNSVLKQNDLYSSGTAENIFKRGLFGGLFSKKESAEQDDINSRLSGTGSGDGKSGRRGKPGKKGDLLQKGSLSNGSANETAATEMSEKQAVKKIVIPALLIGLLLIISAAFFLRHKGNRTADTTVTPDLQPVQTPKDAIITVKRVNEQEKELLVKYKVKISDFDIYNYSNDVAVKNGYSKISYTGLKEKNPHWIFPGNVFIMHDGEKVVVQKGDTLWDLCHAKLEKMNADFYNIVDKIEKTDKSDKAALKTLIAEAEKYSYIKQQIQLMDIYKKRIKNE